MKEAKAIKKQVIKVPKDQSQLAEFLSTIGEAQREIEKVESNLNDKIEKLKTEALEKTKPYEDIITEISEGIYIFAQSHRPELTEDLKKKTVEFVTGTLRWQMTPPAVNIKDEKKAVQELEEQGLEEFIRTIKEVNKEAILRKPKSIVGLKNISMRKQYEEFIIKPAEVKIEIIKGARKLKKIVSKI